MRGAALRSGAAVLALAALGATARAQENPRTLAETHEILDEGRWNDRIDVLYELGELDDGGLKELAFAGDDADWQVRLTAVRFLGKLGPSAAPILGKIALRESCPHVRFSAAVALERIKVAHE